MPMVPRRGRWRAAENAVRSKTTPATVAAAPVAVSRPLLQGPSTSAFAPLNDITCDRELLNAAGDATGTTATLSGALNRRSTVCRTPRDVAHRFQAIGRKTPGRLWPDLRHTFGSLSGAGSLTKCQLAPRVSAPAFEAPGPKYLVPGTRCVELADRCISSSPVVSFSLRW